MTSSGKTSVSGGPSAVANQLYNANVHIRSPPYVFPVELCSRKQLAVYEPKVPRYANAPHLNHKTHATSSKLYALANDPSLNQNGQQFITYAEFSRSLTAALFNGFENKPSYQTSMSQASHSTHAFVKHYESRHEEIKRYQELDEIDVQKNKFDNVNNGSQCESYSDAGTGQSASNRQVDKADKKTKNKHSTVDPPPSNWATKDPYIAHRRRYDPMLKQEERIFNQDKLMKTLKQ